MILSVSRRTDVPNYYSDWFFNRIKEKFVYVRNPMNAHQISKIDLSPEIVDCIVFWTKNPQPMLDRLDELKDYTYYFQFTLTGYGTDIECNVPHKKHVIIPVFQKLSKRIGREKVIWRYDPIMFTDKYTPEYHLKAFGQIAGALNGYTDKCVISFADVYAKNRKNMEALHAKEPDKAHLQEFAKQLGRLAASNHMEIASCAEEIDLESCGVKHNCCIDREFIESLLGCRIDACKDKNQRRACGCIESVEIGAYNTCRNGCKYCYANDSQEHVKNNCRNYNAAAPVLCREITADDKISVRKVKSIKEEQLCIFDVWKECNKRQAVGKRDLR